MTDDCMVNMFDINNGKMTSRIPIHPRGKNFGRGIPWGGVALDSDKGIVYVNTGNPHPAILGINRKGDNKRSSSVVAIDLNKEKVIWDFQETAHDLWDFDIPSPPIIHNLKIDNNIFKSRLKNKFSFSWKCIFIHAFLNS